MKHYGIFLFYCLFICLLAFLNARSVNVVAVSFEKQKSTTRVKWHYSLKCAIIWTFQDSATLWACIRLENTHVIFYRNGQQNSRGKL